MKYTQTKLNFLTLILLTALSAGSCLATDTLIVESRKADGTLNTPSWSEVSGKWTSSKNKSRISRTVSLTATNVSVCSASAPVPAFKITPSGLEPGVVYKVEVTFSTSSSHVAAPDLAVSVSATGLKASTIPSTTQAFQGAGADGWNLLGTITPATNSPTLTFTYASGTLSKESRWYADAIRFTRETVAK